MAALAIAALVLWFWILRRLSYVWRHWPRVDWWRRWFLRIWPLGELNSRRSMMVPPMALQWQQHDDGPTTSDDSSWPRKGLGIPEQFLLEASVDQLSWLSLWLK